VTNATCAVIVIGLIHRTVAYVRQRWTSIEKLIDGTPLILYKTGEWQSEIMHEMRLSPDDVLAAARSKGLRNLDKIDYVILERNGQISLLSVKHGEYITLIHFKGPYGLPCAPFPEWRVASDQDYWMPRPPSVVPLAHADPYAWNILAAGWP
jgi:uncharacterized protein DUF421